MLKENELNTLQTVARDVIARNAGNCDRRSSFPHDAVRSLREYGLWDWSLKAQGSNSCYFREFSAYAQTIGSACLSTAFIWVQHNQTLAVLQEFASPIIVKMQNVNPRSLDILGSITTSSAGSSLLRTNTETILTDKSTRFARIAPIVAYPYEASAFFIQMVSSAGEIIYCLVNKNDVILQDVKELHLTGMRATRCHALKIECTVDRNAIIGTQNGKIQREIMVPLAYIGWASSWIGAAKELFRVFVAHDLNASRRKSKSASAELARIRVNIDLVSALLEKVCAEWDDARASGSLDLMTRIPDSSIRLNGLKIAASEYMFNAVDNIVKIGGLLSCFSTSDDNNVERVWRDLRAAVLLYHNDHLIEANLALIAFEGRGGRLPN